MIKSLFICLLLIFFYETHHNKILASEKKIEAERLGHWSYYCINEKGIEQCEIARKIKIDDQNENFLIIYRLAKSNSSTLQESLNIIVPPRADKTKNLKLTFDDKTKFSKKFLKCMDHGCLVVFKSGLTLNYSLKNFDKMNILFHATNETEPVSLTLDIGRFEDVYRIINDRLDLR